MSNDFQKRLWEHLQLRLPEGSSLSEAISETLSLGKDAAYRRLRGETALTANELLRLAERYALSLDELYAQQRDLVPFRRYHFIRDLDDYRRYLEGSLKQLEEIASTAGHWFYYQAKDIPVYYQFAFPRLAAFKIYVWLKSVYNLDRINGTYYSLEDIPRDILALAQKQWQVFSRINTSEFWNDTTVLS
jgi:Lhr-like helicases